MEQIKITNLAFLPSSGAGHIPSTIEFAKRLLLHPAATGRVHATLLLTPAAAASVSSLSILIPSASLAISVYHLPSIDLPSLGATDGVVDLVSLSFQLYATHVKSALAVIDASALIIDFFATAVVDVAKDLNIPAYVFFASNASMLALTLHLPALHDEILVQFEQFHGKIRVPGLAPIPPISMPCSLLDKKSQCYFWYMYHAQRLKEVRGILVNTLRALDERALSAMALDGSNPPIHSVGPVLHLLTAGERHECLRWLDAQPEATVVFLCFGSKGRMSAAQAAEVATGIECSRHRFLWSLWLADGEEKGLPVEFLEGTRERGMVWEGWVPQMKVLGHEAVGGFVTHGGWNSSLESMWYGVPMVTWPMCAEQHLNAFEMAVEMGVAAEMEVDRRRGGWVTAQEVEKKVRWLMGETEEVKKVRERVREMQLASRAAVEMGGSAWEAMGSLLTELLI
ncbi:Baicalein 7-O-glucuronosyltransferase [Platanthera guangdongensis]|uniref:Glycosyltransferase n=1 Tax=Platanthera guangdongensis TaxID=2320717 RepID=A0ABR2MUC7_9ASPA